MVDLDKYLVVMMPDGSEWAVQVSFIANHRARCYAEKKGGLGDIAYDVEYAEMYDQTLNDHADLIDWAENNMRWADVKGVAYHRVTPRPVDYENGWANGEKRIAKNLREAKED